jgi:hypothetical protein
MRSTAGVACLTVGLALLAGCAEDAPAPRAPDFVLLVDDGTEEADMIEGEPGAYGLTPRGTSSAPYAVIDVPSGYASFGSWAVWPSAGQDDEDDEEDSEFSTVEYWAVHGVYDDPCRWEGAAPEIGPGVDDLVIALSDQRYTEVVTDPEPVTLGGHDGVLLSVRVPDDLDGAGCTEGRYMFWQGSPGDAHHQAPLGTTEQMWILDVDGQRVVLGAAATAGVRESDVAELTTMVESVRFVER